MGWGEVDGWVGVCVCVCVFGDDGTRVWLGELVNSLFWVGGLGWVWGGVGGGRGGWMDGWNMMEWMGVRGRLTKTGVVG